LFHHISSICVNVRLHTENELVNLPEGVLKVPVGGGGCWVGGLEGEISYRLWLEPSRTIAYQAL
jgi:hypothetical protein